MTTQTSTKTKWALDLSHSDIGFRVKHMMIANVSGTFQKFDVKAETEETDFASAHIQFSAEVNSLSTGSPDRDKHLKSADFFDAENFPQLTFVSTGLETKNDNHFKLHGDLTIRDVTRPVTLEVEFGGIGKDPWGNEKAGFTITGKINRTHFNLSWNAALETGGVLVGEDVRLYSEVQLIKQP